MRGRAPDGTVPEGIAPDGIAPDGIAPDGSLQDKPACRQGVRIKFAGRHIWLPASRLTRLTGGGALVFGGLLGFLPVLGFWMLPLGLLVLSYDLGWVRRLRRRMVVWWERRGTRAQGRRTASGRAGPPGGIEPPVAR